uniref:Uncharacterized protein n=1 Tax=Rhizophora mucronata TaxID=61149 RepID=A0A2P2PN48_RHIMU
MNFISFVNALRIQEMHTCIVHPSKLAGFLLYCLEDHITRLILVHLGKLGISTGQNYLFVLFGN